MFDRIEDTRSDEVNIGYGLHGTAEISDNKAERQAFADVITTKMAQQPAGLDSLFQQKPKKAAKPKAKPPLTEEEQKKKDFEKEMASTLTSSIVSF